MIVVNKRNIFVILFLLITISGYYKCFLHSNRYEIDYVNHRFSELKEELGQNYLDVNSVPVKGILANGKDVFQDEFKSLANFVALSSAMVLCIMGLKFKDWDYPDNLLLLIPTMIVFLFHGIDGLVMVLSMLISFSGVSLGRYLQRRKRRSSR